MLRARRLGTTRGPRRQRWLVLVLLTLTVMLMACGGSTNETIQTEDLKVMSQSPHVSLSKGTASDLEKAFRLLSDPSTELEQRVQLYRFIKTANLSVWNKIRNDIDDLKPGSGSFDEKLRMGRVHFRKAQWANALVWRELELIHRRTAPSRQVAVPPEEHFARAWAKHERPEVAYKEMRGLLKALLSATDSNLYVNPGFVSDIRFGIAVFHALLGKPSGSIEDMAKTVHGGKDEAMLFALDLAQLQRQLALRPDRSEETLATVVAASPKSLRGFDAQLDVVRAIWQQRHFALLKAGDPENFDRSPEGLAMLKRAGQEMGRLRELFDARATWNQLDQQKLSESQTRGEDVPRRFVEIMLGVLEDVEDPGLVDVALESSGSFHLIFPSSAHANGLLYAEGKILHSAGREDEAYQRYEKARQRFSAEDPDHDEILKRLMDVATSRKASIELPQGPLDQAELPPVLRDYTNAAGRYADSIIDDDPTNGWAARYEVALIRYLYGNPQSAEATFETIVNNFPDHPIAPRAAIALLDLQARKAIKKRERGELDNAINLVVGAPPLRDNADVQAKLKKVQKKHPAVGRSVF